MPRKPKVHYLSLPQLEVCVRFGLHAEAPTGRRKRPRCEEWLKVLLAFVDSGLRHRAWRHDVEAARVLRSAASMQAAAAAAFRLGGRHAMLALVCPECAPMRNTEAEVEVTFG